MKIGLAVGYFDPQVGGSEEVVKRLAIGLQQRGHDVIVATSSHPDRTAAQMVVPIKEFSVKGNAVGGITGASQHYEEFLLTSDRDIWLFYAAQIWSTDLALPLLSRVPARTVVVPCGYSGLRAPAYREYFRALPRHLQYADALVYMSKNYQDYENDAAHGLDKLAHIIPNGADETEFGELPRRSPTSTNVKVISVANHYPGKGHRHVIRAFQYAADGHDSLNLIGRKFRTADPRAPYWRSKFASIRDRRISLSTDLSRSQVVQAYKDADVFILGSEIECAPLVLVESMAAGLPFISTRVGNAADFSEAGIVVGRDELGNALLSLMREPNLRSELGRNGRRIWMERHRWAQVIDAYERLFRRLLGGISPTGGAVPDVSRAKPESA